LIETCCHVFAMDCGRCTDRGGRAARKECGGAEGEDLGVGMHVCQRDYFSAVVEGLVRFSLLLLDLLSKDGEADGLEID